MKPSIPNLLNPVTSPTPIRQDRQVHHPTTPKLPIHPVQTPPTRNPSSVNPPKAVEHPPPPAPAPRPLPPNDNPPPHTGRYHIAFYNGQTVKSTGWMLPLSIGNQGTHQGNNIHSHRVLRDFSASERCFRDSAVGTAPNGTNATETTANPNFASDSFRSNTGDIPATQLPHPSSTNLVSGADCPAVPTPVPSYPPQNQPAATTVLAQGQSSSPRSVLQVPSLVVQQNSEQDSTQDIQPSVEQSTSDHPMTDLTPTTENSQQASLTVPTPQARNASSPTSHLHGSIHGNFNFKIIPVPTVRPGRLLTSLEELEFRKQHFMHNVYPPTVPTTKPSARKRSYALISYPRNEKKNSSSGRDAGEGSQNERQRKVMKRSLSATELLLQFSNSIRVDCDASAPGSSERSQRETQGQSSTPISNGVSPQESRSERSKENSSGGDPSGTSSPQNETNNMTNLTGYDRSSSENHDQNSEGSCPDMGSTDGTPSNIEETTMSRSLRKSRSNSRIEESLGASQRASHRESGEDEIQPNHSPSQGNHTIHQLIMRANTVENRFSCDECDASFANQASILRHKRSQHTKRSSNLVKCPECTLLLRNKQNLKRHLATHGPNARHQCAECTAKFVTERARTTHMRDIHGRQTEHRSVRNRSTKCPFTGCMYASNQKTNVKRHYENKHLNIKRFHCPLPNCGYIGSTRANRQAHMKIHENENKESGNMQCGNETESEKDGDEEGFTEDEMDFEEEEGIDNKSKRKRDDPDEEEGSGSPPQPNELQVR